jgi:hypothetical protein
MTDLESLLQCDDENIDISKSNLLAADSRIFDLIDLCSKSLKLLSKEFGGSGLYDQTQDRLEKATKKIPGYNDQLLEKIYDSDIVGHGNGEDPILQAHCAIVDQISFLSRVLLCLRLKREFLFSITDFLRLRLSASLGVLRTQAETVGIIKLISTKPEIGRQWFKATDEESGKEFFRKTNSQVATIMKDLGVFRDYQRGSSFSQHSRASGIAYGYLKAGTLRENQGAIGLIYQEAAEPEEFLMWFCVHINFYARVFSQAAAIIPEVDQKFIEHETVKHYLELEADIRSRAGKLIEQTKRSNNDRIE